MKERNMLLIFVLVVVVLVLVLISVSSPNNSCAECSDIHKFKVDSDLEHSVWEINDTIEDPKVVYIKTRMCYEFWQIAYVDFYAGEIFLTYDSFEELENDIDNTEMSHLEKHRAHHIVACIKNCKDNQ